MIHSRIKALAESPTFHHLVNYAIIGFAVLIGTEAIFHERHLQWIFITIDYAFVAFFVFEILVRILAEDHPIMFFALFRLRRVQRGDKNRITIEFTEHGFWNYFDFILISFSVAGLSAQLLHPGYFQVGRLLRMFRIFRLLEISDHLKEVERRIMSIVPTVFSFAALLLILIYIYAILGMFMFEARVFASCNFSSILDSFVTLFQVMTLDNWSDVMRDIKTNTELNPFLVEFYFVSFVIFTSIIAFNVFIAVMTSQVQLKMETEIEKSVASAQHAMDESINKPLRESMDELMRELRAVKGQLSELKRKDN